jgi:hypothetical protein
MRTLDEFLEANCDKRHYGRIIEVPSGLQSEVEFMSSPNQRFPFIMGPETIHHLKGRSPWEIFDFVGYRKHFVVQRLKSGSKFVLVLFTGFQDEMKENVDSNSDRTKPIAATWENVLTLVEKASRVVGERVRNVFSTIQTTPFYNYSVDFEKLDSDVLQQVNSFEAFEKSGHESPVMVRAFLRHTMKLMELYAGDGYCYSDRGERGSKEYLMPRVAISQLINRSDFFNLSDELNVAEL